MKIRIFLITISIVFCVVAFSQNRNVNSKPQEQEISQSEEVGIKNDSDSVFILWIVIISEGILLAGGIFLLWVRSSKERIKDIILRSERIEYKFVTRNEISMIINNLNRNSEMRCKELQNELTKSISNINTTLKSSTQTEKFINISIPKESSITFKPPQKNKYPNAIIDNGFRTDLSDEQGDSYFSFFDINGNYAFFSFCGTDIERAKANKDTLEIVCEISGNSIDAHSIINEESGSVALKNGKWEVIKKAKIKFV